MLRLSEGEDCSEAWGIMTMAQLIGILVAIGLLLASCGESTDEAYERGLYDGWAETCDSIRRFSRSMEQTLKKQRIC
jgi:hypothetical protein